MKKINCPWVHILKSINFNFKKNNIIITANQIKKSKLNWEGKTCQFEPRLLCKHDSMEKRPEIFKKNKLNIISIKNGQYLLTKSNIYKKLIYKNIELKYIKKDNNSLVLSIGNSESSLIDNLRYSKIFEQDEILGEKILYESLLQGRHRCNFDTFIKDNKISINGTQYETDACYESDNKILIIEAKCITKCSNFNIRQLYFPYRTIYDKIHNKKEIISIFINKDTNDIIHIWKFKFTDYKKFDSIRCMGYFKYKFLD
jgi:uncharacterized protein DUF6997/uncharacterized protein DUF6996